MSWFTLSAEKGDPVKFDSLILMGKENKVESINVEIYISFRS